MINNFIKFLGILIAAILLFLTILLFIVRMVSPSYLIPFVINKVEQETNGRYTLSVNSDSLKIRFISMTVRLGETEFMRNSLVNTYANLPILNQFDVYAKFESFNINAFNLLRYAFTNKLVVDEISLAKPNIVVRKNRNYNPDKEIDDIKVELDSIPIYIGDSLQADTLAWKEFQASRNSILPHILVEKFSIEDGDFSFYGGQRSQPIHQVEGLSLEVTDFEISENKEAEIGDLVLKVDAASTLLSKNLAQLDIQGILVRPTSFHIDSLHFGHLIDKYRINAIKGFRASWLQIGVRDIDIVGFHPDQYVNDSIINIDKATIGNVHLNLFKDKEELKINPKYKPLPQEQIRSLASWLEIDTVEILNADLILDMEAPTAIKPGQITLNGAKVTINNITNMPGILEKDSIMNIEISTRVMDQIKLKLSYKLDLISKEDQYWGIFKAEPFNPAILNGFIGSQFFVQFKSGYVDNYEFNYSGNKFVNVGEMDFEYSNLKVQKLEGYQEYLDGRPKTGFLTSLGNILIPQNRSKSQKHYKTAAIYYEKEYNRDIVHGAVMSSLSGVLSSMGFSSKNLDKQTRRAESLDESDIQKSAEIAEKKADKVDRKKQKISGSQEQ